MKTEEKFCATCINGECVLGMIDYPKEANISGCIEYNKRIDEELNKIYKP